MGGMKYRMKRFVIIVDGNGNKSRVEVLCYFDSDMTNKSYVIFTDYSKNKDGDLLMQAGKYEIVDSETLNVDKNLSDDEIEMVNEVMNRLIRSGNVDEQVTKGRAILPVKTRKSALMRAILPAKT